MVVTEAMMKGSVVKLFLLVLLALMLSLWIGFKASFHACGMRLNSHCLHTSPKKESSFFKSKKVIILSVLVLLTVILVPILYKFTRKRLGDASRKEMEDLSVRVLKSTIEEDSKNPFGDSGLYIFSNDEIAKATNSFNDSLVIGEGHMGKLYLGVLPSGMRVAVRGVNKGIKFNTILAEVNKIAKVRHPNLISILGYSDEGDTMCLVYEYCSNGSLDNWLTGDKRLPSLTWECRLQLAIGVAQGLWFLQNNPVQKMVHGDLKLTNILLNERLEPKLLDFGLPLNSKSKELHSLNNLASDDVFHFGLLLLQLFSGRITVNSNPSTSRSLINEAKKAMTFGGNMSSLIDPRLNGAYDANAFPRILALALQCMVPSEHDRPSIEEVHNKLRHAT
ncbi:hypothetical protein Scep_008558 [Stephania cephalantha]|uniref:non-specific serine/threonine protein kinase n=1 Tax=Stephania cephalantha TaxID=152367 RepID=A0AAP0PR21_9MAGN